MSTIADLRKMQQDYEKTPECWGLRLNLDFSLLICIGLKERGWSTAKLAEKVGVSEKTILRFINSDGNPTLNMVGRILHALNVRPGLAEKASLEVSRQP